MALKFETHSETDIPVNPEIALIALELGKFTRGQLLATTRQHLGKDIDAAEITALCRLLTRGDNLVVYADVATIDVTEQGVARLAELAKPAQSGAPRLSIAT